MKIRVVFNQKGGVGKSTITVNLAAAAAKAGQRVLVVDLDPQANSSHYLLGAGVDLAKPNLFDFFDQVLNFSMYAKAPRDFVHRTPFERLSIMPSHSLIAELESKLESRHKIYKLREALHELADDFDEIWLDTPPALNFFTLSALISAQGCLIPFDCDEFSRHALLGLIDRVAEIRHDHNADLMVEGIVVNQYQARASLPARMVGELKEQGLPVLDVFLGASVKVRESHERAIPLLILDPAHKLSQQFNALYALLNNE
jgi:chromosome partitioning protein